MTVLPLTGRLLIATPALADPNFVRSVVLVLDHDDEGSLGVVINRPSGVPVTDVLPTWSGLATEPGVIFEGGPVQIDSALALAVVEDDDDPVGWQRVHGRLGLIDLDTPPEVLSSGVQGMRVFAGYAGWGPEQLERELEEGAWYVVDAEPGDPFSARPESMWRAVLRRQQGELAFVATCPDDPSLN